MKKTLYGMACSIAIVLIATGCQKKFDASSYAPKLNINGYTAASEVAPSSLVGYFGFNGNYNDTITNTAGTNTGTTLSSGIKGQSMQGALNSYVTATPSANLTALKSFTITEWVNTPAPSTGIIGLFTLVKTNTFWGNIEMFIENGSTSTNGKVRLHIAKGTGDYTFAVDNVQGLFDKWNAIAVTYDATTSKCRLYVNAVLITEGAAGALTGDLAFTSVGKLVFGTVQFMTNPSSTTATTAQSWASYLTGKLDEVRIYNKVLTDTEISSIVLLEGRGK